MRALIAIVLLGLGQFALAADPVIGRIFYTPEERARLDTLRIQRAVATQVRKKEPIPEFVTYNGIVRRSDGQVTVWVNGEPLTEAGLRDKQSIAGRIGRNGQILVQTPQAKNTAQVRLKVGQSAELLSGRVEELYAAQVAEPASEAKSKSPMATAPAAAPKPASPPQPDARRGDVDLAPPGNREAALAREGAGDAAKK